MAATAAPARVSSCPRCLVCKGASYFPMWCGGLVRAVGQRHELVIVEEVRRLGLHDPEDLDGQFADLDLRVPAAAHLDEMAQGPGVGGHEDLGFGGVGQHAAGG